MHISPSPSFEIIMYLSTYQDLEQRAVVYVIYSVFHATQDSLSLGTLMVEILLETIKSLSGGPLCQKQNIVTQGHVIIKIREIGQDKM